MKTLLSWSGGKDSTMALYETLRGCSSSPPSSLQSVTLLTTVTRDYDRISIHGVRRELLHRQAASLQLELDEVFIPKNATNAEYETRMIEALTAHRAAGIEEAVFGDLFLSDVRAYRERLLARVSMRGVFPVWGRDTTELIHTFLELGFKAVVTCVDRRVLDASFAGRTIDREFLAALPSAVDPCGENGEFHSFVFDGPLFKEEVSFQLGESVERDTQCFRDLMPA